MRRNKITANMWEKIKISHKNCFFLKNSIHMIFYKTLVQITAVRKEH